MTTKKPILFNQNVADFMSMDKFNKLFQTELKTTTISYPALKEFVMFFDKLNPEAVVLIIGNNTPLMIKTPNSDSGIVLANLYEEVSDKNV